ncbi:hypothetical protein [Duganella vulcania]|uniref:Uncharacterized protein n=1 Tax=Duganella vulcania TaxID=2692166 RepID=A0A845GDR0_9BURK|nr:hypothetical protein [Duganella vulcania]MYM92414.1 hypothetical protein [Duganella vulcania]
MPIESAERMSDLELVDMFQGPADQTRAHLVIMKAQDMEVLPSESCDKQD